MDTVYLKKFVFTLNNYTRDEEIAIRNFITLKAIFSVIGHEVGDEGTPHLQGYVSMATRVRFSTIKRRFPRIHLEKARGSDEQNLDYCTKQDKNPFIFGEPDKKPTRSDLHTICKELAEGCPLNQAALNNPEVYVKYSSGLTKFAYHTQQPRSVDDPPMTIWIWGPSGTGKTRFVYDQMPHDQIYIKDDTQWWDGYIQQSCVLVDDFDGRWPFRNFLRLLDRYPYQAQVKGGYVVVNSGIIVITCEYSPQHFWHDNELLQVTRRLQHIMHYT